MVPLNCDYALQPRILHRDPVTDAVENLTLMYCPPERRVTVPVRIKVGLMTVEGTQLNTPPRSMAEPTL